MDATHSKLVSYSFGVVNMLDEIVRDGNSHKTKCQTTPKNYLAENIKELKELQSHLKHHHEKCKNELVDIKQNPYQHIRSKVSTFTNGQYSPNENTSICQVEVNRYHNSCCSFCDKVECYLVTPHPLGYVPNFISCDKRLAKNMKKNHNTINEDNPTGHILLSEEERQETLQLLLKNKDHLWKTIQMLPLQRCTLACQKYKDTLEKNLAKVEEGIKLFSRPQVFIKDDS